MIHDPVLPAKGHSSLVKISKLSLFKNLFCYLDVSRFERME